MTAQQVLVWPNKGLRVVANEVTDVTSEEVRQLAEDIKDTMKAYNAQGLAATQIGVPLRVFGFKQKDNNILVLVNPELKESVGEIKSSEGCLSFPGVSLTLTRANSVVVKGTTMFGDEMYLSLGGLEAVAVQHELDHLNGIVMTDYLGRLDKRMAMKRLKKVKKRLGVYARAQESRIKEAEATTT